MSQVIKFYFTSMLIMFWTLILPTSGACNFAIVSPHWLCILVSMCVGVAVWLVWVVSVWQAEALVPQPAYRYHTTTARPQRNTNTHQTRAVQPMK